MQCYSLHGVADPRTNHIGPLACMYPFNYSIACHCIEEGLQGDEAKAYYFIIIIIIIAIHDVTVTLL